jgi:uncharacterized membrane protein YecN with MAPEG domain
LSYPGDHILHYLQYFVWFVNIIGFVLFLAREIVEWGCFARGETEAKRGTTAMIVASEKCIFSMLDK